MISWLITTIVSIIAIIINRKDKQLEKKSQIIDSSAKNITNVIINNNFNITPEVARQIKDEAEFISSTTSSPLALTSAAANLLRAKAIKETPNLDKFIKEQEKNKEKK